jgi:hypothetical protein
MLHQLLVLADDVNILLGNVQTIENNKAALVVASKETVLEVNADRTKYMVMPGDQNAGRSQNIKTDNSSTERVKELKYLGLILTYQNCIQEETDSRLKSRNVCYHSVQNLLSSSLLSKNLNINIYRTINFPVVVYGCETWSLTLKKKRRFNYPYSSPSIVRVTKSRRMRWTCISIHGERRGGGHL